VESGVLRVLNPPYPLLADPEHEVAEAFGVYDLLGTGYAAPSVFVIDTGGDIIWSYVGASRTDRPDVASLLEQLP
jgi:peroxiredoxin